MPQAHRAPLPAALLLCVAAIFPAAHSQTNPTVDEIVARMRNHEAAQSQALKHYEATRRYQIQYKGFGTVLAAAMDVDLQFDSSSGKAFRIVSQSGSKLLCDKVLKRAVESEEEASKDKASTALTPANYRFQLVGSDEVRGRPAYLLTVDPLKKNKFLYRGKVWVDSADFAVVKIEVEPAQNPSFWISSTQIEYTTSETDGIWLPRNNRSESRIRVGGTAVLTIDYGSYRVTLAQPTETTAMGSAPAAATIKEAASEQ